MGYSIFWGTTSFSGYNCTENLNIFWGTQAFILGAQTGAVFADFFESVHPPTHNQFKMENFRKIIENGGVPGGNCTHCTHKIKAWYPNIFDVQLHLKPKNFYYTSYFWGTLTFLRFNYTVNINIFVVPQNIYDTS